MVTAVATTVVSFLPVFMLTGRDYKLFAPLAWTKSFSLLAALIVAVTLVPLLSRLLLSSTRASYRKRAISAVALAILLAATCYFLWGDLTGKAIGLNRIALTLLSLPIGVGIGYWLLSERLRPVEENPISRVIRFFYEPALRLFLAQQTHIPFPPNAGRLGWNRSLDRFSKRC